MLQLHLSDRQFYCLLRCNLYYKFYGKIFVCANNIENDKAPCNWPFVRANLKWLVDSPNKGPVMQKVFPYHDIIIGVMIVSQYVNFVIQENPDVVAGFPQLPCFLQEREDTAAQKHKQTADKTDSWSTLRSVNLSLPEPRGSWPRHEDNASQIMLLNGNICTSTKHLLHFIHMVLLMISHHWLGVKYAPNHCLNQWWAC